MTWIKRLFFADVTPLIRLGLKRPLQAEDIPEIPEMIWPENLPDRFRQPRIDRLKHFLIDISRAQMNRSAKMFGLCAIVLTLQIAGPLLLGLFMKGLQSGAASTQDLWFGLAMIACGVGQAVVQQHYYYVALLTRMQCVNGLNFLVYRKTLTLSRDARSQYSSGEMVNLIGVDTDSVSEFLWLINDLTFTALMLVGVTIALYMQAGVAAVGAVGVLLMLLPVSRYIGKRFNQIDTEIMKRRDERVSYVSQVLSGIRVVKFFAWEDRVYDEINRARLLEVGGRKRLARAGAAAAGLYAMASFLIGLSVFGGMMLLGVKLDPATVFPCLALFALIENPFGQLTGQIAGLAASLVSADRIRKFLTSDQLPPKAFTASDQGRVAPEVRIQDLRVGYDDAADVLSNLSLTIRAGESVAIIGGVGSGKTSLLMALLGEVPLRGGSVRFTNSRQEFRPRIAYVPQESAIINGDLRENVLFGGDELRLENALQCAALGLDLSLLPAGIRTEIGEQGVNLSGGQKQRVGIARAVVQDPELILLDDPMSAIDEATEDTIMRRLVFGEWSQRTRIVVTHRLRHLKSFDRVLVIQGGRVVADGPFDSLKLSPHVIEAASANAGSTNSDIGDHSAPHDQLAPQSSSVRITVDEDREVGAVDISAYRDYLNLLFGKHAPNRWRIALALVATVLAALSLPIATNIWISKWGSAAVESDQWLAAMQSFIGLSHDQTDWFYLSGFLTLGLMTVFFTYFAHWVWSNRAVETGRLLHDQALMATLKARVRFYDATPVGRILNRFSRDVDAVERDLAWSFQGAMNATLSALASLTMIIFILPALIAVVVPVMAIYWWLQKAYRVSGRETKRLYSIARSPRFAVMKETIHSLTTLRAMNKEEFFWAKYYTALRDFQRMFHGLIIVNRWFSIRIPILSVLVSLGVGVTCWNLTQSSSISAGVAGLVLIYALRFWETLNWSVRAFSEAEAHMTSVERLRTYSQLPAEVSQPLQIGALPHLWPSAGKIVFDQVSIRYDESLPDVIRDLSVCFQPGRRTALIGRTGSGKSTLVQALFRFVEVRSGRILIDGSDLRSIPLATLRRSLAIIPQDPVLFQGSLRSNIDRFEEYKNDEIWRALARVGIDGTIRQLPDGLETKVAENGLNLSLGQRQLICMARAILMDARIIIMDEATASLDVETDHLIQSTITHQFMGRTVIVVAHRPSSIRTCDFVVELSEGKVVDSTVQRPRAKGERQDGSAVETCGAPG